jgi:hypothetical protein
MAYEMDVLDVTLLAAGDLSSYQYRFVKISADNTVTVCGKGETPIGILQNVPTAAGQAARVRVFGVSRLEMQATIAFGDYVGSEADGEGVAVSLDTEIYCAVCLDGETLVGHELCTVMLTGPSTISV